MVVQCKKGEFFVTGEVFLLDIALSIYLSSNSYGPDIEGVVLIAVAHKAIAHIHDPSVAGRVGISS